MIWFGRSWAAKELIKAIPDGIGDSQAQRARRHGSNLETET